MPPLTHPDSPVTIAPIRDMTRIYMSAKDRLRFALAVNRAAQVANRTAVKLADRQDVPESRKISAALDAKALASLATMLAATPANVDAECTIAPEREAETA
jgi:hypothetical protein